MNSSVLNYQASNQTLNQGKINHTTPFRKIRIIVSDPDATDSSSDDLRRASKNSSPKRRRIGQEICIPYDDAGEKAILEGAGEMNETNLKRFRGVRRRKSGRWSAEIRDPFNKKRRLFLGSFGTGEEASRAFEAKKDEFRERRLEAQAAKDLARPECGSETVSSSQSLIINDEGGEKSSMEGSGETTRTDLKRFRGVRRLKSGSWSAEIRDPFKKRKVFLGVFGTGEEASRVFEAKRAEFRKRQEAQSAMNRAPSGSDLSDQSLLLNAGEKLSMEDSGDTTRSGLKRFRGVRRRRSGKWSAEILDPFMKRKLWLGSFGTAEEASRAFEAKKDEFRERRKEAEAAMDLARPEYGSEIGSSSQSLIINDEGGEKSSMEGSGKTTRTDLKPFLGVRRRKSGSWSAEIRDPFKKRKVLLGVFGTGEEASRVFEAKRAEFLKKQEAQSAMNRARSGSDLSDQSLLLNSGEKMSMEDSDDMTRTALKRFRGVRRRSGRWSAEILDPFMKRKLWLGSFGTGEEASRAFEAKKVEFLERQDAQSAMDRARHGIDSFSQSVEQIEVGMNLGSILIDNNGFLLGEFSHLDDDLKILDRNQELTNCNG